MKAKLISFSGEGGREKLISVFEGKGKRVKAKLISFSGEGGREKLISVFEERGNV